MASKLVGTFAYMDPEYMISGEVRMDAHITACLLGLDSHALSSIRAYQRRIKLPWLQTILFTMFADVPHMCSFTGVIQL